MAQPWQQARARQTTTTTTTCHTPDGETGRKQNTTKQPAPQSVPQVWRTSGLLDTPNLPVACKPQHQQPHTKEITHMLPAELQGAHDCTSKPQAAVLQHCGVPVTRRASVQPAAHLDHLCTDSTTVSFVGSLCFSCHLGPSTDHHLPGANHMQPKPCPSPVYNLAGGPDKVPAVATAKTRGWELSDFKFAVV